MDHRASMFLPPLNTSSVGLETVEESTDRLQRQRQALNGALSMSSPPLHSSVDGSLDCLNERKSPSRDMESSHASNLLAVLDSESERTILFPQRSTKPNSPSLQVDIKLEQKRLEHERQRIEQRKLFEEHMKILELRQMREEQDLLIQHQSGTANSAPTTPPASSSDTRARANTMPRLSSSANSFVSVPKAVGIRPADTPSHNGQRISSRSVPTSRRNSDAPERLTWPNIEKLSLQDRDDQETDSRKEILRSSFGRPFNRIDELARNQTSPTDASTFPQFNDKFLYDDDGETASTPNQRTSSYVHKYLQMNTNDDKFPILVRRDSHPGMLSASSTALDLASLTPTSSDRKSDGISSKSIPRLMNSYSAPNLQSTSRYARRSSGYPSMPDILEVENNSVPSLNEMGTNNVCRFYQQGWCARGDRCQYAHTHGFGGMTPVNVNLAQMAFPGVVPSLNTAAFYGQYGMTPMGIIPAAAAAAAAAAYNQNIATLNAAINANNVRIMQPSSVNMKMNQKRMNNELETTNKFAGVILDDLVGEIYSLCKDQHGCRYLQKKLEEKNERYINMIFNEVSNHFVELMTDPFGNYLCQKLLECCSDEQRTIIVKTVASELVNISLNMHGTRAVQKMIEFLNTPQQIEMVIVALNLNVVTLIKDLNGNHVIQKCLNRLGSEDNQFIYNAVSKNCIEVSTHRHGCCVLQRCIDHASESQKIQLVTEITYNALKLVQDPFGNYVVQYVLDLKDNRFTDALIRRFVGNVCLLSVQKFSSNVMEKCIRVAQPDTRRLLVEEMLNKISLEKLLRDCYANYVVQTSLDYADPVQRAELVDCIKPLLPAVRNTPYGKRIQGKLHRDQQMQAMNSINMNNMLGFPFNGLSQFGNMGVIGLNEFTQNYHPYM
ncbi:421_t:CDS:2 [Paraglomus brasilianum]|uniref:421_t:CDS:1 n=1 Tax=Paraglomus brasilianum TaxID=144538 RepID=A0A9N8VDA6_9GLOM|nr:421_t:CDS:2 [Paraglomus brasilianum]